MKNILSFIVIVCLLAFTGCATNGGRINSVTLELAVGVASDAAALVLQKNSKAVPAVRTISESIGAVLTTQSLSPQRVKQFVDLVGKDANLNPAERLILGRAVQRVHGILVAHFGTVDLNIQDPKVREALEKIKKGVDDTLALYDVLKE